jgi:hypothetical protein
MGLGKALAIAIRDVGIRNTAGGICLLTAVYGAGKTLKVLIDQEDEGKSLNRIEILKSISGYVLLSMLFAAAGLKLLKLV